MSSYQDYLNQAFQNPDYKAAQAELVRRQNELSGLVQQLPNYAVNQQRELMAKDPALQQLNQQRAQFQGQLFSQPLQARDQYRDIFDPVKREALVSQSVGNVLGQLSGTNALIGQRQQTAKDLADQALELLKARVAGATGNVEAAQSNYKDLRSLLQDVAKTSFTEQQANYRANLSNSNANKPKFTIKYQQQGVDPLTNLPNAGVQAGMQFLKNGVAIAPAEWASENGYTLDELLRGSPSKDDQIIAQDLNSKRVSGYSNQQLYDYTAKQYPWLLGLYPGT